jgi:hypothetical protein
MEFAKLKNKKVAILLAVLVFGTGGYVSWYDSAQIKKEAIAKLENRNILAKQCFKILDEDLAAASGPVGSSVRNSETLKFYDSVMKSPCVQWGDGSIYENIFFNLTEKSPYYEQFRNSYFYTLTKWNGREPLKYRCADGWQSPSIGKRGACSHHGGVISGFSDNQNWSIENYSSAGKLIYPDTYTLEQSTK